MNEERIRELFREMREEPMPADSLARVRMRVAERTQRSRAWWRIGALIAAAAAAYVVIAVWTRPSRVEIGPPPLVAVAPKAPEIQRSVQPAAAPAPVRAVRPHRLPVQAVKQVPQQSDVLIRIETPDPNVVLYFVAGD